MNTHPAFISDAYDDLADVGDPWAPEPSPAPGAPAPAPAAYRAFFAKLANRCALMTCDPAFLALVDPMAYLLRGQLAHAFRRGAAQTGAYQTTPGAYNALRSDLHSTGVL